MRFGVPFVVIIPVKPRQWHPCLGCHNNKHNNIRCSGWGLGNDDSLGATIPEPMEDVNKHVSIQMADLPALTPAAKLLAGAWLPGCVQPG